MITQLINQQGSPFYYRYGKNTDIPNVIYTGLYQQVQPKSYFHKGDTYITGVKDNETRDPVIYRYRASDNTVVGVDVGVIDGVDPLDHQNPLVFFEDNFVYVVMVNPHAAPIRIWKSNTTDVTDGFSVHYNLSGSFSYVTAYKCPVTNSVYFLSRFLGLVHGIGKSNGNDYTDWTTLTITDNDYGSTTYRHYPFVPRPYGDNEWYYFALIQRNDSESSNSLQIYMYFAHSFYKTKDFKTFYSLDESFSKNIPENGVITNTEVQNELTYIGSAATDDKYVSYFAGCVIDDVIYGSYLDQSISYYKFYKIENGVKTEYDCNIPNLPLNPFSFSLLNIYYNGNNLVIRVGSSSVWVCDLDFSNQKLAFTNEQTEPNPVNAAIFPVNLDEVYGDYLYGGGQTDTNLGVLPYYITQDKFIR